MVEVDSKLLLVILGENWRNKNGHIFGFQIRESKAYDIAMGHSTSAEYDIIAVCLLEMGEELIIHKF